ncbi:Threonine dehydratase mitochondrial [Dissostichus eleginoides]|uniref:Threonine dehydratase mitochondrial n=1 Tax=Dissostichus eleginoides TaxID=100907 RepID=A0AAD9FJI9_DISEL|nr:Threonine dehydratase mitochondrial [Dissostichus eleginoides]
MVMELPTPAQPHSVPWRHGDKTKEEERGRGRLAAESGTEEQIEANAARHPGFPDVRVLPVVFLLEQTDL